MLFHSSLSADCLLVCKCRGNELMCETENCDEGSLAGEGLTWTNDKNVTLVVTSDGGGIGGDGGGDGDGKEDRGKKDEEEEKKIGQKWRVSFLFFSKNVKLIF